MKEKNTIFFVKYPEKGKIKTRLAKSADKNLVVELYKCFVSDMLETLERLHANVLIFYKPGVSKQNMQSWLGDKYPFFEQAGSDLGERMYNAFFHIFQNSCKEGIIIGSDIPDLPAAIIAEAFENLRESDMVIGPSKDGGYYLLGLKKKSLNKILFQNISWSSEHVFSQTLEKSKYLNYKVYKLPVWEDIDIFEDLVNLYKRNSATEFYHSRTMKLLRKLRI